MLLDFARKCQKEGRPIAQKISCQEDTQHEAIGRHPQFRLA